jgi:CubicO group peptidase (beta-lactamase class C family)
MRKLKLFGIISTSLIVLLVGGGFAFYHFYLKPMMDIKPAQNYLTTTEYFDQAMVDSVFHYTKKNCRNGANIAIAIVDEGRVHYFGVERKLDKLTPIENSKSLYQIGSISKVFTSIILAHYALNKEIKLDESIDKYLGYKLNKDVKLKWQDLANHTTGLDRMPDGVAFNTVKNFDNPYASYNNVWMENYLKTKVEIISDKKGKSNYSNLGVGILGSSLALFKNTTYDALLNNLVTKKYGLNQTFVYKSSAFDKLVKCYDMMDSPVTIHWELNAFNPAGGIVSNTEDMSKFILANLDNRNGELNLTHLPTARIDSTLSIGLGWHILKSRDNRNLLFHNGATGNFRSSMFIDKDRQKGIIILSNVSQNDSKNSLDRLSRSLIELINLRD